MRVRVRIRVRIRVRVRVRVKVKGRVRIRVRVRVYRVQEVVRIGVAKNYRVRYGVLAGFYGSLEINEF